MSLFHTTPHFLTPRDRPSLVLKEIAARVMATGRLTHGAFSLAELTLPEGFATQVHVHLAGDEALYILQGQLNVLSEGIPVPASAGAFVFLPRGMRHGLTVVGHAPATVLWLRVPAGLDGLMLDLDALQVCPDNAVIDVDPLNQPAARCSIEVLGPMPLQEGKPQP